MSKKTTPQTAKTGLDKVQVTNLSNLGANVATKAIPTYKSGAANFLDPKEKLLQEDLAILNEEISNSVADRIILAQAEGAVVSDAAPAGAAGGSATGGAAAAGAGAEAAAAGAAVAGAVGTGALIAAGVGVAAVAAAAGGGGHRQR